eukprot:jgi/Chlat1/6445/Chrsp45S05954
MASAAAAAQAVAGSAAVRPALQPRRVHASPVQLVQPRRSLVLQQRNGGRLLVRAGGEEANHFQEERFVSVQDVLKEASQSHAGDFVFEEADDDDEESSEVATSPGVSMPSASTVDTVLSAYEKADPVPMKNMTVQELQELRAVMDHEDDESPYLIDVRTPEEYANGHVPGADNLPLQQLEYLADVAENKEKLHSRPVHVICQAGIRSVKASNILIQKDCNDVTNILGGTGAWVQAGFEVEK